MLAAVALAAALRRRWGVYYKTTSTPRDATRHIPWGRCGERGEESGEEKSNVGEQEAEHPQQEQDRRQARKEKGLGPRAAGSNSAGTVAM